VVPADQISHAMVSKDGRLAQGVAALKTGGALASGASRAIICSDE